VEPAQDSRSSPLPGLSSAEADRRRAAGQGNDVQIQTGRTYGRIVRDNVFNFINNLFYVLGIVLLALGRPLDAFVVVFVILANTVISLGQEIRAKRVMDKIAILTRPKAEVLRDGTPQTLDPSLLVVGDIVHVEPGDQIVVDGPMVGGRMEVDESLLTGESDLVTKHPGDPLLSGSFCVTGGGYYEAEKVGLQSFANKLTAKAKGFKRELTPLQRQITQIVRVLLLIVVAFEILIWVRNTIGGVPFVESVRMATVTLALIPNGLVLSIALTYALGAVRLLGKDVLVQQFNAIESLSNVDTLCTDKTGTLTSGAIALEEVLGLGAEPAQASGLLGTFAASTTDANKTIEALRAALAAPRQPAVHEALFSSARKWSGLAFASAATGTYVLGAPEMISPSLEEGSAAWQAQADAWAARGLRVMLFAGRPEAVPFASGDAPPTLPSGLRALALVALSDELRPGVRATLDEFTDAGIEVKIISGDNPTTVTALAMQAGLRPAARRSGLDAYCESVVALMRRDHALPAAVATCLPSDSADSSTPLAEPGRLAAVAGADLDGLDDDDLAATAERATVFGRVTPEQKEDLVNGLRSRGHYVAMIGDGVNDVIALKQANVAVAVQGGSQAARGVSDLILLKDTFAPLPFAFREGQRIINGMNDILRIFMVRIAYKSSLILAITALGGFPFAPRQASLVSFVTAGVPAVALAAWSRPGPTPRMGLFRLLARFVLPTALLQLLLSVAVWLAFAGPAKSDYLATHPGAGTKELIVAAYPPAQTALTLFASFCGILLVLLAVPPSRLWGGGSILRGDWRMLGLVGLMLAFVAGSMAVPLGRTLFELTVLPAWQCVALFALAVAWAFLCRLVWHSGILNRWLGTAEDPGNICAKHLAETSAAARADC